MANEMRSQENLDQTSSTFARVSASVFPYTYHEITDDKHVVRLDVLEQLKSNIAQLEDLHGRLRFMMGEVRGLLKR